MEDLTSTELGFPREIRRPSTSDPFFEHVQEINDLIARRAYELFASKGFTHGHHQEDWLQAESEILHPVPLIVIETETELTVRAEVPGFSAKDIEVRVEHHSLLIIAQRQEASEQTRGNTLYAERQSNLIFRVLDLPTNVDPERVKATLSDGLLEVTLSKVAPVKKIPVLVRAATA